MSASASGSATDAEVLPIVTFVAATVVCALYYGFVFKQVPQKRSLNYKGRLALYLATSKAGTINDFVMAVFSIGSCVLFVWETYLPEELGTPLWMFCTELVFSTAFTFQYFVSLYTTHNVVGYLFSLQAMVDVVTIIPVYITLAAGQFSLQAGVGFLRFSRVMKFTRVLRLLRLFRSVNVISSATDNAIRHQIILLMTTVISILVVTTGFVQYMGNELEQDQWGAHVGPVMFHDALYFTVVTFTTVGYGDVAPSGVIGRLVITALIAITFVLVPFETSKLVRLARLRSNFAGTLSVRDGHSHIILCCDLECTGVSDFLNEFFHEDHGAQNTRVCLLVPGEPTMHTNELLLRHKRLAYLKGDAMAAEDLTRARADVAVACFILTNRFCADADEQDSITILRSLNVKSFSPQLDTFVQVIEPENVTHVISAGVKPEHIVCVDAAKLGLLGQSSAFPGFSTLITNLISSVSYSAGQVHDAWQREYVYGLMQEIYQCRLPRAFAGHSFTVVAYAIYKKYGASLFAVGVPTDEGYDVRLSPGSECIIYEGFLGFIIAEDQRSIDELVVQAASIMSDPAFADMETPNHNLLGTRFKDPIGLPPEYEPVVGGDGNVTSAGIRRLSVAESSKKLVEDLHGSGAPEQKVEGGGGGGGAEGQVATPTTPTQPAPGRAVERSSIASGSPTSDEFAATGGTGGTEAARRKAKADRESAVLREHKEAADAGGAHALAQTASDASAGDGNPSAGHAKPAPSSARVVVSMPSRRDFDGFVSDDKVGTEDESAGASERDAADEKLGSSGPGDFVRQLSAGALSEREVDTMRQRRKLARATLVAKFEEVIDNMYGTTEADFLDDLSAVMNIVMVDPAEQARTRVQIVPAKKGETAAGAGRRKRRSSFVGKASVAPRVKRRALQDAVRDSLQPPPAAMGGRVRPGDGNAVHDHVLVVCSSMDDLQYFIAPLRSPYLTRQPPVVILCSSPPDEREWAEISAFDDVYFLEGVPHLRDLHRAAIASASVAVIVGRTTGSGGDGSPAVFSANDAEVVLTVLDIQASVRPNMRTLAELNSSRYMKHLGAPVQIRQRMAGEHVGSPVMVNEDGYIFESSYSSGRVLPANFLEALLCQAFFNPYIVSLVNVLSAGCPVEQTHLLPADERAALGLAEGTGGGDDKDDDDVSVVSHYDADADERRRRSYAVQVPVPRDFTGTTYGDLLHHLLFGYDMLPIGLYRYGKNLGNALPFVLTNPPAHTGVAPEDLVYVIAPYERLVAE